MSEQKFHASCLCNKVKITAHSLKPHVGACHCGMCRKWGGGPLLGVEAGKQVSFEGEEYIGVYNSSAWGERGFCKQCGTHLFYRFKETQEYNLPAGLLDDAEQLSFVMQIFIDRKPNYYSFSNETENLTEADIMAMYHPKE